LPGVATARRGVAGTGRRGMSYRTPLGRVLGLGSAHEGVGHWWIQRLTAVALIPLTLWLFFALVALGSPDYQTVREWMSTPVNAVLASLLVLTLSYHSRLGVQVVVEDYVHHRGLKLAALVLVDFLHLLAA